MSSKKAGSERTGGVIRMDRIKILIADDESRMRKLVGDFKE